jgi:hypothetical protein
MHRWRTWAWLLPLAALAPSLLWASPFGPARDIQTRLQLFLVGYPAWLILTLVWLVPGLLIAKAFRSKIWYTLPCVAIVVQLAISAPRHWPPSRWWPVIEAGQPEVPSGYFMGFAVEAWHGYLYSLWARTFIALVTAVALLLVQSLVRTDTSRAPAHDERIR